MLNKSIKKRAFAHVLRGFLFPKSRFQPKKPPKVDRQSFRYRLRPFYYFTNILIVLLLLWSGLTESLLLWSGFWEVTEHWWVTLLFTALLVLLIEITKYFTGTYFFKMLSHGWLREGKSYRLAFIMLLPMTIGVYFASVYLSVKGAPQVIAFIKSEPKAVDLVNLDSIHQQFNRQIGQVQADKENAKQTTWRGITTQAATELLHKYEDRIARLEAEKQNAILAAEWQNAGQQSNNQKDIAYWGSWLQRFGGFGECITLLLLYFTQIYLYSIYQEDAVFLPEVETKPRRKRKFTLEDPIEYEGKSYKAYILLDWMNKAKHRANHNKTAKSRTFNRKRYQSLKHLLDNYDPKG